MLNHGLQIESPVETSECVRPNPSIARSLLSAGTPLGLGQTVPFRLTVGKRCRSILLNIVYLTYFLEYS